MHSYVLNVETNAAIGQTLFYAQEGAMTYRKNGCILSHVKFTSDYAYQVLWLDQKIGSVVQLRLMEIRGPLLAKPTFELFTIDLANTNILHVRDWTIKIADAPGHQIVFKVLHGRS
jgi:hypothetical protein